jgi:integrase
MSEKHVELVLDHLGDIDEFRDDDFDDGLNPEMLKLLTRPSGKCSINLANIPVEKWDTIRVSSTSTFGDVKWDFQTEAGAGGKGSAKFYIRKNVSSNVKLTDAICEPLRYFVKALIYYNLPENALFVPPKSYNTVVNDVKWIAELASILFRQNIFVLKHRGKMFNEASTIVKNILDKELTKLEPAKRYGVMLQIRHWELLSESGYLPERFRLNRQMVSAKELKQASKKFNADRESRIGYLPIKPEVLGKLIPACADMVEKHSTDILALAEAFDGSFIWGDPDCEATTRFEQAERVAYAMLKNPVPELWDASEFYSEEIILSNENKNLLKNAIRSHEDWDALKDKMSGKLNRGTRADLRAIADSLNINTVGICSEIINYDTKKARHHFISLARRLRTACEIVVMFSTGMRIRELNTLKAGCARRVPGTDDHELEFYVHKTRHHATIPIPELSFKAITVLEKLTRMTRGISESEYLAVNMFHNNYGKERLPNEFATLLTDYCQSIGITEHIHPHQFRKSIAMFFVYHDPCSLMLVKRLFSHRSLKMTLRYIVEMPGLGEEIRKRVIDNNLDLLLEVYNAAEVGAIGGLAGKRFAGKYKDSKFCSYLNDDGRESARMFVAGILESDAKILSRCTMGVICTKTHHTIADSAPNECDCDVVNCENAIFTSSCIDDLEEEIRFHSIDILQNPATGTKMRERSEKHIEACRARLAELRPDPPTAPSVAAADSATREAA